MTKTTTASKPKFIITGGAGFIGSNLTLALQEKFPDAHLTVIDDFRSGDFKNLAGYRGDFVAENLATLDWREKFGDPADCRIRRNFSSRIDHRHDFARSIRPGARQRGKFPPAFEFCAPQKDTNHLRFLCGDLRSSD